MHVWSVNHWEEYLPLDTKRRTGLRLRIDADVDPEVRRSCKDFAKWLRKEYVFPLRIPVYIKGSTRIKTYDGELVVGSFFEPYSYHDEPYIRIATGDYSDLEKADGRDNALATILVSIAHELTHYYQWINNLQLTPIGRERQASKYADDIVDAYAMTREHP